MRRKIYLASSWRNEQQQELVAQLRADGHEVYDYKNPAPGVTGFSWRQVTPEGSELPSGTVTLDDMKAYFAALSHPRAQEGFKSDFDAMRWADTFVLLLPCGRSAHLEAGWAAGAGKECHVVLSTEKFEPELMYLCCDAIHTDAETLRERLLERAAA